MIVTLSLLSQFKYDKLMMTVNFVDVMILDADTVAFFLTIYPDLLRSVILARAGRHSGARLAVVVRSFPDPHARRRRRRLVLSGRRCRAFRSRCRWSRMKLSTAAAMSRNSSIRASMRLSNMSTRGYMDSDATVADNFRLAAAGTCRPAAKPPHIIMILDESSFDITAAPGIKVPDGYGRHFRSFDGKGARSSSKAPAARPGLPNTACSPACRRARSAALPISSPASPSGRVERGLPHALQRCGYRTFTLYPARGAFMSARGFQKTAGIEQFFDAKDMGAKGIEPD